MRSKLPFSSNERTLKEIYAESQDLIYRFNRTKDVKNQMLRLRRARERIYEEILDVINANVQRPGKVYYRVTRDGKKTKTKGEMPVLDLKNSFICYDEESFAEAGAKLDSKLLKLARWQVEKQGLPAIFYLGKPEITLPLLDKKTYDKCRKLCHKLDKINDDIKKLKSEGYRANSDLEKCKALLSKVDEEQRGIVQELKLLEWLYEEAEETSHVLQKGMRK
ncbi:MAG: hypothetical protein QMD14_04060 [Candidatus Aenigmarchaeota archaeon]|nr:hypothetical protein [Candidatus Aenigmarchaeota archaeon]